MLLQLKKIYRRRNKKIWYQFINVIFNSINMTFTATRDKLNCRNIEFNFVKIRARPTENIQQRFQLFQLRSNYFKMQLSSNLQRNKDEHIYVATKKLSDKKFNLI